MIRLVHTPAAQDDLLAYYDESVQRLGELLALESLENLFERCEDLARFPDMGRHRPDLDSMGVHVRGVRHDGRLIAYVKRGGSLHVLRILRES